MRDKHVKGVATLQKKTASILTKKEYRLVRAKGGGDGVGTIREVERLT